jgi:hypothetical protein
LIFGTYHAKRLRRKSKANEDKISLELNDVFMKTCSKGRDVYFQTVVIDLIRIDKAQAKI